ncbi:MaoC/PaaZ C-terminal domain-containing protein [Streptomyces sp. NBC_01283]|uniref:MaoC/PaaZ C-terminal domain-containing protein n=1 Tax=Streptomyces sp. NBC_01283 TaxID=2903812 RepID=UPI00352E63A4|nr:MaoC/PaaZ C-terminal domain-containing protein [Streptomyces sp. NBC_01283]
MLAPLLLRGAILSPFKRARSDAPLPTSRPTLSDVRPSAEHLAVYSRLCGFRTAPHTLPLTYPHVLSFPLAMRLMTTRAFPLPLLGLVHTSIEITQHRAPTTADTLELSVHASRLAPHRRGTEATLVTEARVDGSIVWTSSSTYLARHRTATPTSPRAQPDSAPLPALAEWPIARDLGRRYGAVSGDRNPIHLYPLTARLLGFPRAIAHGMWTVARCLAEYGTPESAYVQADFKAPVLLPGTVTYAADGPDFQLRDARSGTTHITGTLRPLSTS